MQKLFVVTDLGLIKAKREVVSTANAARFKWFSMARGAVQSKSKRNDYRPTRRIKEKTLIISYRVLFPLGRKDSKPQSV